MSQGKTPDTSPKRPTVFERTCAASSKVVWDLWTTQAGIESWWGPDGFSVSVPSLDLRSGGEFLYTMTAVAAPQIEFMKKANLPLSTVAKATYVDVHPVRRLSFFTWVDFVKGVAPYKNHTVVELEDTAEGVRMRVTVDAMHDEPWTQRTALGWKSQLDKLAALIARQKKAG